MRNRFVFLGVFFLAFVAFFFSGCGRAKAVQVVGAPNAPGGIPPFPTPTPTFSPLPTVTPPPAACTETFQLNASLLNGANAIAGRPVAIHLQAFFCPGVVFKLEGRGEEIFFQTALDVTATYPVPGNITESFIVSAFSPSGVLLGTKHAEVSFTVFPAEPAGTCTISRAGNSALQKLNDPLAVRVETSSAVVSSTLNGAPYQMGATVPVPPSVLGTGQYVVNVQVTTAQQNFSCSATFQIPVCTQKVTLITPLVNNWYNFTSETVVHGQASDVFINGWHVPPASITERIVSNILIYWPYPSQGFTSRAQVYSGQGDIAECSDTVYR